MWARKTGRVKGGNANGSVAFGGTAANNGSRHLANTPVGIVVTIFFLVPLGAL